jgi:hypothetical protein
MRKKKDARKDKNLSLGGSKEAEKSLLKDAKSDRVRSTAEQDSSRDSLRHEANVARAGARTAQYQYDQQRDATRGALGAQDASIGQIGAASTAASGLLGQAQGTNQLTGTTDSILSRRAETIGAAPGIVDLTNQAIVAQDANQRAANQYAQGQLAKQAMGMAAGQGEGGALAAQQAMASLVGAGGDMAAQGNLAQAQQAAAMRAQAAQAARGETVAEAGYAADARIGAANAERANQLATAARQAEIGIQGAQATNAARAAYTGANQALTNTTAAQQQFNRGQVTDLTKADRTTQLGEEGVRRDYELGLLSAAAGAGQSRESAAERPAWAKALFPMGMLGPQS